MTHSTTSLAARAFAKIKVGKPKKLKKKSLQPLPRLTRKADRALQDWYRREWAGRACESCGTDFELMHHFVEKSQSTGLRFEDDNLIFLCHRCHFRHHRTGDSMVMGRVVSKRGIKWLNALMKLKVDRKGMQLDRKYLEAQLIKYK